MKTKKKFLTVLLCLALAVMSMFAFSCDGTESGSPSTPANPTEQTGQTEQGGQTEQSGSTSSTETPKPTAKENAATLTLKLSASIEKIYEIALEVNVSTTDAETTRILTSHESDFKTLLNDKDKIYELKTALLGSDYADKANAAVTAYEELKDYAVNDFATTKQSQYDAGIKAKYNSAKNKLDALKLLVLA